MGNFREVNEGEAGFVDGWDTKAVNLDGKDAKKARLDQNVAAKAVADNLQRAFNDTIDKLDEEIKTLDTAMKEEDALETIRRNRIEELQRTHKAIQRYKELGHGVLTECHDGKEFFQICKASFYVVSLFYTKNNRDVDYVRKQLRTYAGKQMSVKCIEVDAERFPNLCEKLKIWMIPSVLLVEGGKTSYTVQGLDEFGGRDFDYSSFVKVMQNHGMGVET